MKLLLVQLVTNHSACSVCVVLKIVSKFLNFLQICTSMKYELRMCLSLQVAFCAIPLIRPSDVDCIFLTPVPRKIVSFCARPLLKIAKAFGSFVQYGYTVFTVAICLDLRVANHSGGLLPLLLPRQYREERWEVFQPLRGAARNLHTVFTMAMYSFHCGYIQFSLWLYTIFTVAIYSFHCGYIQFSLWLYTIFTVAIYSFHCGCIQFSLRLYTVFTVAIYSFHCGCIQFSLWLYTVFTVAIFSFHCGCIQFSLWLYTVFTVAIYSFHCGYIQFSLWLYTVFASWHPPDAAKALITAALLHQNSAIVTTYVY